MSHHYSDPLREHERYALPDVEVFYCEAGEWGACDNCGTRFDRNHAEHEDPYGCCDGRGIIEPNAAGWYYWFCFPGCVPEGDGDPNGPYETEQAAIDAARAECSE